MVLDNIKNAGLYKNMHPGFAKAFDFILNTDLSGMADGKYEIQGDDIFAIVQQYNSKNKEDAKLEAHKKYIDIQYINSGVELIGVSMLDNQIPVVNEPDKDLAFYNSEASFIKLNSGMFAIFFPHDLHMPGIKSGQSISVKKVVIKVKI